jgi:hypothetical protein
MAITFPHAPCLSIGSFGASANLIGGHRYSTTVEYKPVVSGSRARPRRPTVQRSLSSRVCAVPSLPCSLGEATSDGKNLWRSKYC